MAHVGQRQDEELLRRSGPRPDRLAEAGREVVLFQSSNGRSLRWGQKIGASFYYFNASSQMHTGWLTWSADKKRSYFDPKTGKAYVGWHKIGGKNYYFDL